MMRLAPKPPRKPLISPQLLNAMLYELTLDSKYLEGEFANGIAEGDEKCDPARQEEKTSILPSPDAIYHCGLSTAGMH
jgi:hypothetical protein